LRKKPFPDIFQAAFARLGASAQEVLVFEDSERGLQAAAAAGADAVLLRTPFNANLQVSAPFVAELSHVELGEALGKSKSTASSVPMELASDVDG
jgi:beta-phosphoglucomutase-like phosphatase (HAD superfamily)